MRQHEVVVIVGFMIIHPNHYGHVIRMLIAVNALIMLFFRVKKLDKSRIV